MMDQVQQALRFSEEKHRGQFRKGGAPYFEHPLAVAEALKTRGFDEAHYITALFHDLLEDTDATEADILDIGGSAVLKAVRLLTKPENYEMSVYLAGISEDPMAKAVKCADRIHNLQTCCDAPRDFQEKYYEESLLWYCDFMAGTVFESAFQQAMQTLAEVLGRKDGKTV